MPQDPRPRSFQQTVGDLADAFQSRTGVGGVRVGGPLLSLFEAAAQSSVRSTQDVFAALNASDPSRLVGEQLDRYGLSKGVRRRQASPATTDLVIGDSSFTKKSSRLSPLRIPPAPGQLVIYVQDADSFPSSGSVYVGRGTQTFEGALPYSSKTDNGSDWTLTLSSAVQRQHVGDEEVVVAQGGDRTVPADQIVQTAQGNALQAAQFRIKRSTTIPDGEVEVSGVLAVCTQSGEVGNVPAGALSTYQSAPFSGATVNNPLPVRNGRNIHRDQEYQETIRLAEASRSRGTRHAEEQFAVGVTAPDEPRTVLSASFVERKAPEPAYLTIDDGTGYQPVDAGVVSEVVVGSASGGEASFALSRTPLTKGRVLSERPAPWALAAGAALAFEVGGVITEHVLNQSNFLSGIAEPYAVAEDVNGHTTLPWEAFVSAEGGVVGFRAKSEFREELRSVEPPSGAPDAATTLGLGRRGEQTLFLYLNDQLLYKDGRPAALASRPFSEWGSVSGSQTLVFAVDGTPSVTATIVDQDFIDAETGYTSVGRNSPPAWAAVLQGKLTGLSVTVSGSRLLLTSNLGASDSASVEVVGGSLVGAGFFDVGSATGLSEDYSLDRSTGEIFLSSALVSGDRLAAGSDQTRAFAESNLTDTITFSSPATWWMAVDSEAVLRTLAVTPSSVYAATVPTDVVPLWGARLRLTVAAGAFSGLLAGDYVVFWDAVTPTSLYGAWTVAQVASDGSWFEIERIQGGWARSRCASCVLADGKVFVCGGFSGAPILRPLRSAEVYDPATKTWTFAGLMATPRADHWAVLLDSGKVLVGGGTTDSSYTGAVSAPELWTSPTTFAATSTTDAPTAAVGQAVAVVAGIAYVTGGQIAAGTYSDGTWSYDEGSDTWTVENSMSGERARHTLTALGTHLWAAGGEDGAVLNTVEDFDTGTGNWASGGTLVVARQGHRASVTSGTDILLTGGSSALYAVMTRLASTERLVAGTPPWVAGPAMTKARAYHGQALLSGGKVLVAGGEATAGAAELYDTAGPSWATTGTPKHSPRQFPILQPVGTNSAVLAFGENSFYCSATSELYTLAGATFNMTDPVSGSSFSLTGGGVAYAHSHDRLRKVQAGASADLTAYAVQVAVNAQLAQGGAGHYLDRRRTTRLRWRTNTWASPSEADKHGDIMVVTQDVDAAKVGLPAGVLEESAAGQVAWVLSGNPDVGTPDFEFDSIVGSSSSTGPGVCREGLYTPSASHWFVGDGGLADTYLRTRVGQTVGHYSQFSARTTASAYPGVEYITLRSGPEHGWWPHDRCHFAAPFAIGPYDDLVVVADHDSSLRRYSPHMYRRLKPVGSSYAVTCSYQDADLSPVASLGTSFGIAYDFTDHSIFMRARGKSHAADATRSVLWRWWRHGVGGESADVSYAAPAAPDAAVAVTVDDLSGTRTHVFVHLAGGAQKTGAQIRPSTRLGLAAINLTSGISDVVVACGLAVSSATRATNVTTLTVTLPTGITAHGIPNSSLIYFASTDVNFSSGIKTLTSVTGTTLVYDDPGADVGPDANPGTVSFDIGEALFSTFSPAVAANDWLRIDGRSSALSTLEDRTLRVTSSGPQVIYAKDTGFLGSPSTTLSWGQLLDPDYLLLFANPTQSVTTITTAAAALYTAGTSPVSPTVLGTGAGTLYRSSDDEAAARGTYYRLYDGRNAVASQVAPGIPTNNYSLTLKYPVEASLASGSDWANEDVRIAPVIAPDVSLWLQSSAVSGLYPGVRLEPAYRGRHVQLWSAQLGSAGAVQVQGGAANAWSFSLVGGCDDAGSDLVCEADGVGEITGVVDGMWGVIKLTTPVARTTIGSGTTLDSLSADGTLTVTGGSAKLWVVLASSDKSNVSLQVEVEGRFVRYQDAGLGTTMDLTNVGEGDWAVITAPASPSGGGVPEVAAANLGVYRVVRASTNDNTDGTHCFWVEVAAHEAALPAEADVRFISDGSILPGDIFTFGDDTWGEENVGEWVVAGLGDDGGGPYSDERTINLDTSTRAPVAQTGPIALGTQAPLFRAVPATPQRWIKRVKSSTPATDDTGRVRVRMSGDAGSAAIGETYGAVFQHLDKLEFSTDTAQGRDAYRYYVGLVGEVNKVEFGSAADPVTYPGVLSKGASVRIDGPKIRRVFFSLAIRTDEGFDQDDVVVAVKSAVAAAVAAHPHGEPIPISEVMAEVQRVVGLKSAVPLEHYTSEQDSIEVRAGERAKVLDVERDVSVTVLGA